MKDKEKFEKLKKLADAMYYATQHLTTDSSGLHKAMDEYHKFIINEYHKEEPVSEGLEQAIDTYLATYFGGDKEKRDWPFLKKMAIHFAKWKKQKDSIPVSEDLEEAAKRYVDERMALLNPDVADMSCDRDTKMSFDVFDGSEVEAAFYEGAQWQKKQDQSIIELAEDHAMLAGMVKGKEEVIAKACKYLQEHREEVETEDNGISGWISDEFIEDFENYMKG